MKSLRAYEIVEYVKERKFCSLNELMEKFGVSTATIHRDVASLVRSSRLRKVHGGVAAVAPEAALPPHIADHYRERLQNRCEEKLAIAEKALAEIEDGDILFLDSSTTVYYLGRLLQRSNFANLTLVTNSMLIIQEFPLFPANYFLIALGGNYDLQLNAFLGQATLRELERLSIDKSFLSALGMTPDGISSRHENHALFLRRVLELSRRNHLLLSSDKFDKSGIFRIAPLSQIDRLISDAPSPGYFYGRSLKFESLSRNDGRDGRER